MKKTNQHRMEEGKKLAKLKIREDEGMEGRVNEGEKGERRKKEEGIGCILRNRDRTRKGERKLAVREVDRQEEETGRMTLKHPASQLCLDEA